MATNTTNYNLVKPEDNEFISASNANMDIIDKGMKNLDNIKEELIKNAAEKTTMDDADALPMVDSADSSQTKKITFTNLKAILKTNFDTLYNKTVIANNLTTTIEGSALDAVQGKALADSIFAVNSSLNTVSQELDANKENLIKNATEKTTLVDADAVPLVDSEDSSNTKKITFTNMKTVLKTYFDTLYNKTVIANNLTTTTEGSALDAVQGKILDGKISTLNTSLTTKITDTQNAVTKLENSSVETEHIVYITTSQNWTVPSNIYNNLIDVFLVAGGGSGALSSTKYEAAGGGGGGYCMLKYGVKVASGQVIATVIGQGGTAAVGSDTSSAGSGSEGGTTSFGLLSVAGGGGGVRANSYTDPDGGAGTGGGGGAGSSGGAGASLGNGGIAKDSVGFCPFNNLVYAGGGGGSGVGAAGDESAGAGSHDGVAGSGVANRGGGGGGCYSSTVASSSGAGGSGVVVIRYFTKG